MIWQPSFAFHDDWTLIAGAILLMYRFAVCAIQNTNAADRGYVSDDRTC